MNLSTFKGMHARDRIILALTTILILIALGMLISNTWGGADLTYPSQTNYAAAQKGEDLPVNAPDLPLCAKDISIDIGDEMVNTVSFTCGEKGDRDAFIAQIRNGFQWDVLLFEGTHVQLERVGESAE